MTFSVFTSPTDRKGGRNERITEEGCRSRVCILLFLSRRQNDVFPFLTGKGIGLRSLGARRSFGPVGWKKIILAALRYFFPPSLATQKRQSKNGRPVKSGKTIPMGFIHSKKNKNMKIQLIESIGRLAVTAFLLTGIVLLWNKGIVPVCTITLLLMAGNITSWLFHIVGMVIKLSAIAVILAMLV